LKTTRRFQAAALFGALSLILANLSGATISEVIQTIRSLRKGTDFFAEGRLVSVNNPEQRITYRLSLKGKSFGGTVKLLFEVTDPIPSRLKLLIESPPAGMPKVRLARALDRTVEELTSESLGAAFLGSVLNFEDLLDAHFSWSRQTLLREEKCAGKDCYVIRSQPGPDTPSHYSAVTSWIDKKVYLPICVEKDVKASESVKVFLYSGIRESKGVWGARQVEVRIKGERRVTLLIMTRGSGKANLSERDFDPSAIFNFGADKSGQS
jgi:hypothetical protein